jgi:hypothetical protein
MAALIAVFILIDGTVPPYTSSTGGLCRMLAFLLLRLVWVSGWLWVILQVAEKHMTKVCCLTSYRLLLCIKLKIFFLVVAVPPSFHNNNQQTPQQTLLNR